MRRVQVLPRYDDRGASSRLRMFQYLPRLRQASPDLALEWEPLLDNDYLERLYARRPVLRPLLRGYARRAWQFLRPARVDARWVEKELWPWVPAWLEHIALRGCPYVLDLDDAIFHNYDLHPRRIVRRLYGRKIDALMRRAALVVAGNDYLAARATAAGAPRVQLLPTVVDLDRYGVADRANASHATVRVIWIGSPSTASYLQVASSALAAVARAHPIALTVIGAEVQVPGVDVQCLRWSEETEATLLREADIGIMPLRDTPWERGKCGYKLVQYMACGLPVVATGLPANRAIVVEGVQGFMADNDQEWIRALTTLALDPTLRARMGQAGRERVELHYSLQAAAPRLHRWLDEVAGADRRNDPCAG